MGPTIESRFNNNGTPNGIIGNRPVGVGDIQRNTPDNRGKWLIFMAFLTALLSIVVVILLVMILGREEKVCTYEDVMETIRKDPSPSENWKIYEDFMIHNPEKALKVYANILEKRATEENYNSLIGWAEEYVKKYGGKAPGENEKIVNAESFIDGDSEGNEKYWGISLTTESSCMRFDFSVDFLILEKYSLTAGRCDELNY